MFCSQCGNQIDSQSSYCTKCGNRAAPLQCQDQPPVQAATAALSDSIVWIFRADRKLSMFKIVPCYIVFMRDKAVLAFITPALQKAQSAKVSQDIKSKELGFFKGSAAMMRYWSDYYKKYYTMSADAILAEDPSNRVLYYQNISQVLFKGFSDDTSFDDTGTSSVTQGKLYFSVAGGETLKFSHSQSADKSVKETLTQLFGAKLKYKR